MGSKSSPSWKAIRSSKTKRISPSGISIPVKLYYKKEEKIEESFVEVDKVDLPKEWQESEQIEMDTGENDKEKL